MVCLTPPDSEGILLEVVFCGREYKLYSQRDVRGFRFVFKCPFLLAIARHLCLSEPQ